MATKKYAYYIEGNKIAIAEQGAGPGVCSLSGYSSKTTCEAAGGTWTQNATNDGGGGYRSPKESIADGLEIKYTYIPEYNIKETDDTNTTLDIYKSTGGYLILEDSAGSPDNFSASPESLSDGSYIVLENAGKFNGLHKVKAAGAGYIDTYTKYSGTGAAIAFEETVTFYYNVSVMIDESFELDIPRYLQNAVVYYLKAKMAEDMLDLEKMQYYMREFKRQVEKHSSGKITTTHRIQGFSHMNRKY